MEKFGLNSAINILSKTLTCVDCKTWHVILAKIPWRRVYTTNYDNCYEFAAMRSNLDWQPVTVDQEPDASSHRIIHINGYAISLSFNTIATQIKLTHSSYSIENFVENKWAQQFRQDLNVAKAVIFVGYSMSDLDISRLLFSNPEIQRRTIFVVAPK